MARKSTAIITLLLLWTICLPPVLSCGSPLLLTHSKGRIPLAGHMEIQKDETGSLTIQDVISSEQGTRFLPVNGPVSVGFLKRGALWIRCTVQRAVNSPPAWILEMDPAQNEHIQLYQPSASGGFEVRNGGTHEPFSKRENPYRLDQFQINLPSDLPQTFYIRIASSRAIIASPLLWQPQTLRIMERREAFAHGTYFGIVVLTLIVGMMYWIRLRDSLYFYYITYVICLTYAFLDIYGYAHQLFWTDVAVPQNMAIRVNNLILLTLNACLLSKMLDLAARMPRFNRYFRNAVCSCAGAGVLLTLAGYQDVVKFPTIYALLLTICISLVVCVRLLRRAPGAGLYLAAFGILLIAALNKLLINVGLVPYYEPFRHLMLISTVIHIIVMNIAVLNQVVRSKREKLILEAELAAEQQTVTNQRQFLRLISHELRTPLAIIDSTAQIIPLIISNREQVISNAHAIRSATRQLSELISNYLTHDRLESRGLALDFKHVDICELIKNLAAQIQLTTENHLIRCDLPNVPYMTSCDPMLIEMTARLLLENAVKYSPFGGNIILRVYRADPGQISIEICDCGVGLTPEQIDRVFDPFYRAHVIPGVGGVGLGLHLAKHITELHGGSISCSSIPSQGSTFTVHLKQTLS